MVRPVNFSPKVRFAQRQQKRIALADAQIGQRFRRGFGVGGSQYDERPFDWWLTQSPFPDAQDFCGRERAHSRLIDRVRESGFRRLGHGLVALPAFVFKFDVLDGDGIGIGVKIGQGLIFADPAR